jgi:hypothetical protein
VEASFFRKGNKGLLEEKAVGVRVFRAIGLSKRHTFQQGGVITVKNILISKP